MEKKILLLFILGIFFLFGCTGAQNIQADSQPPTVKTQQIGTANNTSLDNVSESKLEDSFYKSYTKAEFEAARAAGKTIFLEFHANWCPVCKKQEVDLANAFSDPNLPNGIAGFRVHYRDDIVNADEENLAREHGISYQYSKVILGSNGEVLLKEVATPWSKEQVIEKLSAFN